MTSYQVLHQNDICTTTTPPAEDVGKPVTQRSRSVTCSCGRAGVIATPGFEDQILAEWAARNGYSVTPVTNGFAITYTGGRGC